MKKVLLFGKKEPYGEELVLNGSFDNADNWILAGTWAIAGGEATHTTSGGAENLLQNMGTDKLVPGTTYKVEWTQTGSWLAVFLGGLGNLVSNSEDDGSYSVEVVAGTNGYLYFRANTNVTIDNVSLKEVL